MASTDSSAAPGASRIVSLAGYGVAMIGPVGSAAAQFLLSLLLLRSVDAASFGRFSFLLIASQFSWGVWSALFCAPLPILFNQATTAVRERAIDAVILANLLATVAAFVLFAALGLLTRLDPLTALLFAGYAAVALLRWFGRAYAYAAARQMRTMISDSVYAGLLLVGTLGAWTGGHLTVRTTSVILLAAAAASLIPFGAEFLQRQFVRPHPAALPAYREVWRAHAGWSLIGVLTTEATANAHAYLVTLLCGPTVFAPVAASALLIRPIMVAINALIDFERARMARQIGAGALDRALASRRFFLIALMAIWVVTGVASFALLAGAPRLVFPGHYSLSLLVIGTSLWLGVGLLRSLRVPDSALLQAGGGFRPLAMASVWSSLVSVIGVVVLIFAVGPLWSVGGIIAGEGLFALFTWRAARIWIINRSLAMSSPAEANA